MGNDTLPYTREDEAYNMDRYILQETLAYIVALALEGEYNDFLNKRDNFLYAYKKAFSGDLKKFTPIDETTCLMELDSIFYHRVFLPNFFLADLIAAVMLKRPHTTVQEYKVTFSSPHFEGLQTLLCCTDLTIRDYASKNQAFHIDVKSFKEYINAPALALDLVQKFISSTTRELMANFKYLPDFMYLLELDSTASVDVKAYFDKYKRRTTPLQVDSKFSNVVMQAVTKAREFILQKLPGANFELELPEDCKLLDHFLNANSLWAKLSSLALACERLCENEENIEAVILPRFELVEEAKTVIVFKEDDAAEFREVGLWICKQVNEAEPFPDFDAENRPTVPVEKIEERISNYLDTVRTVRGAKPQLINIQEAKANAYVINKLV